MLENCSFIKIELNWRLTNIWAALLCQFSSLFSGNYRLWMISFMRMYVKKVWVALLSLCYCGGWGDFNFIKTSQMLYLKENSSCF